MVVPVPNYLIRLSRLVRTSRSVGIASYFDSVSAWLLAHYTWLLTKQIASLLSHHLKLFSISLILLTFISLSIPQFTLTNMI